MAAGQVRATFTASCPAPLKMSIASTHNNRPYAPPRKSEKPQGVNLKGK
jgi:hypothetical protein